MKLSYAILATLACLVLAFCIAAAITAQASHTWWEMEKNGTERFYFGLYQVCVDSGDNSAEMCYTFRMKEVKQFVNEQLTFGAIIPVISAETKESQDVWILSFFAIVFTGMAFILSLPTAILSFNSNINDSVPKLLCFFTAVGTILGITSVAYAYDQRENVWSTGVNALKAQGLVTGKVDFVGRGSLFQVLYSVIEVIAFIMYAVLIKLQPSSKEMSV